MNASEHGRDAEPAQRAGGSDASGKADPPDTRGRFLMQVLWPSFLIAIPATGLFFSAIDPAELEVVQSALDGSRQGAYTVGFLLAWIMLAAASALTYMLAHRPR